ncbi:MAG: thioredoxin family protein [Gemmatimonadaceae bacterium]|nr:thioredoxin family protein [Gemmatimonadaceae bacterium]
MDDRPLTLKERFLAGSTFAELLARPKENSEMWNAVFKRALLTPEAEDRAKAVRPRWHLLVLNEDWCGDSVNILPYVARLEEAAPNIELRLLGRDSNRDLMDAHLTRGSRSIPVVIVYDDDFAEKGWWGPRPGPLQEWVVTEGLALPKPERYPLIRAWYARDRGKTIMSEILSIIEDAGG